jgi:hypothetical protein
MMHEPARSRETGTRPADEPEVAFGSNEVRLSPGEWGVALVLTAALMLAIPRAWTRIEPLPAGPDFRLPFRLGYDYWTFDRACRRACAEPKTLVVGDSVVWGHYVDTSGTLSHYLNQAVGEERFVNLGVDGIHPVALAGLLEHYGRSIENRSVILNCNLLWMSSKRHDLQVTKEFSFNHPRLVPQVLPKLVPEALRARLPQVPPDIPCYKAKAEERLGIVASRTVPFLRWARHLQVAYFDDLDLPAWTIELPSPDEPPSPEPDARPWTEQGIGPFNAAWVELDTSLQWQYLRRAIEILQGRGNRVFVLVGPFNEHMLTDRSRAVYDKRKQEVEAWLRENGIPHAVPPALPSRLYADASHPLSEGYHVLAEELLKDEQFVRFVEGP